MTKPSSERIFLSPPCVGETERKYLLEAFESGWIAPVGPHVDAFEQEIAERAGVQHAAALASGTAGLHLALRILGVQSGDDVIVSTLTFIASANVVTYVGATPVFVDCDRATWNMDPDLLANELRDAARRNKLPKAVIVVDLCGQVADFDRIRPICREFDVPIIEDAAEALGARYRHASAGSFGDLSVFSFNGNKMITTSGGGMLVSDRKQWIDQARHLATQARDNAPHYEHSTIGYNYRLSNLLAALGRAQLTRLDEFVEAKRRVNTQYRALLGDCDGIDFMPEADYGQSSHWLTCITVDEAQFGASPARIVEHLAAHNIEARPLWKPMHLQPVFKGCRVQGGRVSEQLFETGLCLPSGPSLRPDQVERIVGAIKSVRAT